jgi:NADPH:quinone reductase-like Zn-dependent oxidoreductase
MVGKDPDTMAHVLAVRAVSFDATDPLRCLQVADDVETTAPPNGWRRVRVKAAGLNRHDIFSLQGVGLRADELPRVLGCDGAGVDDDGNEVVVHGVIGDPIVGRGDPVNDPKRSLLSERYDGTFAEYVVVPAANVVPKPAELTFEEAACLPTAWLTAYRMLFANSGTRPGDTVLVQGAGGGVSTAAIGLARAAGLRVWVTSRTPEKRDRAVQLGAHAAFEPGARLPERVDAVLESVGQATWAHSVRSVRPGGVIVVCGATTGDAPPAELTRVFYQQLRVIGSTMGSRQELLELLSFCALTGVRPVIDRVLPLREAADGFAAMWQGELFGKVVFTV